MKVKYSFGDPGSSPTALKPFHLKQNTNVISNFQYSQLARLDNDLTHFSGNVYAKKDPSAQANWDLNIFQWDIRARDLIQEFILSKFPVKDREKAKQFWEEFYRIIFLPNKTNNEKYQILRKYYFEGMGLSKEDTDTYPSRNEPARKERRAKEVINTIQKCKLKFPGSQSSVPLRYTDIGSGEGDITKLIQEGLALSRSQATAADVLSEVPYDENFHYLQIQNNDLGPIPSNSQDFVTSLMVLHHSDNPKKLIKEINRILMPGGYLFIREHDVNPALMRQIKPVLDAMHVCYEQLFEPNPYSMDNDETYHSMGEWINLLNKNNFDVVYVSKRPTNNPCQNFNIVVRKVGDIKEPIRKKLVKWLQNKK